MADKSGLYLGIDVGTSGARALLMAEDGSVLQTASADYPLFAPKNGWAEQPPELWWEAVASAAREALRDGGASELRAVGLTGQMHGLVCLDGGGRVLRPAILWCDQRTAAECAEITEKIGAARLIELTANPALTGFTAPKILWVRKNEPRVYEKTAKMMLPKDYIRYKLTGEHATDVSDASGTGIFNVSRRDWEPEALEKLDIDPGLLGRVFESREITGAVSAEASALTGIPAGTPVAAGAGDNAAAAVGTGVTRDGEAFVTIGSSGVVFAHTSSMTLDPRGRVHTFCAAVPGEWHVMGVTLAAGMSLKWFRDNFAPDKSYPELDALASIVPIGADRLIWLPYLNGERSPHLDPDCRGAFVGLSGAHGAGALARAVMEGVAFSLRDCRDIISEMGVRFDGITVCGGGGASPFWRQMLADVLAAPISTIQTSEGPALGAAMLAAVAAGAYAGVPEAAGAIIRRTPAQQPDGAAGREYMRYHALYGRLYESLRRDFKALAGM
jgi:xylulokinase